MHDRQIGTGKFSFDKRLLPIVDQTIIRRGKIIVFHFLFQLNPDGTYNKKGVDNALQKHWAEWSIEKIVLINSKCFDECKAIIFLRFSCVFNLTEQCNRKHTTAFDGILFEGINNYYKLGETI